MNHKCTSCGEKIPNGQAVIRSIDFEQVAWHKACFGDRVPEQGRTLPVGSAA